jgi:hypothetical protein
MLRHNTKVEYHSSYKDLFGKERFVKLVVRWHVTWPFFY